MPKKREFLRAHGAFGKDSQKVRIVVKSKGPCSIRDPEEVSDQ